MNKQFFKLKNFILGLIFNNNISNIKKYNLIFIIIILDIKNYFLIIIYFNLYFIIYIFFKPIN